MRSVCDNERKKKRKKEEKKRREKKEEKKISIEHFQVFFYTALASKACNIFFCSVTVRGNVEH